MAGWHPVLVFGAVMLVGYALLLAVSVALGQFITRVLLASTAVERADDQSVHWLVAQRTDTLKDVAWVGATLAGGHVIPALIGLVLLVCVIRRHWRIAAFVLFAVAVESATYRMTTLLVPRDRPAVDRLESLPVNESYPSGHTAATIALYGGLALLASGRVTSAYVRVALWLAVAALVPFVALSRMLSGMHHPLDVAGGVVIGIGALIVLVTAARAAGVAADEHRPPLANGR